MCTIDYISYHYYTQPLSHALNYRSWVMHSGGFQLTLYGTYIIDVVIYMEGINMDISTTTGGLLLLNVLYFLSVWL